MKYYLRFLSILIALLVSRLSAEDSQMADAAKKDLDSLQGKWELVSAQKEGKDVTQDFQGENSGIEFKNDAWIQDWKGLHRYTAADSHVKLDPSKSPKTFDHIVTRDNRGQPVVFSYPGIYELEGDSLTICFDVNLKTRPSQFATDGKSGYFLAKFKRPHDSLSKDGSTVTHDKPK